MKKNNFKIFFLIFLLIYNSSNELGADGAKELASRFNLLPSTLTTFTLYLGYLLFIERRKNNFKIFFLIFLLNYNRGNGLGADGAKELASRFDLLPATLTTFTLDL